MTGAAVPFTVLGGFLGAGKTTLLNRLLAAPGGMRFAVLVNDFGSVAIDRALVREHAGDTIALANGCVCCSMANGFIQALLALGRRTERFDHVVIEASGVADPARTFDIARLEQALSPNGIVVLADASAIREQAADRYVGDMVARQLAAAHILVVNKTDLVSAAQLADLVPWLRERAPHAAFVETRDADVALSLVLGIDARAEPAGGDPGRAGHTIEASLRTVTYESAAPLERRAFEAAVSALPRAALRGKGFVRFDAAPHAAVLWQKVGGRSTLSDLDGAPRGSISRVVLIGTADLDERALAPLARLFTNH